MEETGWCAMLRSPVTGRFEIRKYYNASPADRSAISAKIAATITLSRVAQPNFRNIARLSASDRACSLQYRYKVRRRRFRAAIPII
ncbi:MAG: hypothetical protein E5Y79_13080 [Mesorhizobium sp.]|uniref:hypothetical protein n=1 Tax=Mesorhizobium sp. TaxID=1871066 RepID=UPI00122C05D9|nr:hypothetical protein [Mesorhizobium sp.]TIL59668.1 MAG: hypothetical protein E5Y79_13080 [Mesorhizobium sp.]